MVATEMLFIEDSVWIYFTQFIYFYFGLLESQNVKMPQRVNKNTNSIFACKCWPLVCFQSFYCFTVDVQPTDSLL